MSISENAIKDSEQFDDDIQFDKIPVIALRQKARQILSQSLNQIKVFPSDNGFPRDWRGIADLAGLRNVYGQTIQRHTDQMEKVIELWCTKINDQTASIDNLIKFLVEIDRWDVLADINEILMEDAKFFKSSFKNMEQSKTDIHDDRSDSGKSDENILTVHDVYNAQQNLPPQHYDAFVLYDESDEDFAAELINRVEGQGFKLCLKERDLIGGISFEHEAVMRLISERCNRLIVIYSPEFLRSPANTYLVNYAQSLGIERGQRKILPCIYKYCNLPTTLRCIWHLDYNRLSKFVDFWDKLRDSILQTSAYQIRDSANQNQAIDSSSNSDNIPLSLQNNEKVQSPKTINSPNDKNNDADSFVELNLSEITKSYNEEVDIKGYTPLINDKCKTVSNSNSKKSTKKWMNLKKWFPTKVKSSKNPTSEGYSEKEKSKRKFKRQKLVST